MLKCQLNFADINNSVLCSILVFLYFHKTHGTNRSYIIYDLEDILMSS